MISRKKIEKIQQLQAQGTSVSQIARALKTSRPTILKHLNKTEPEEILDRDLTTPLKFDDLFEMGSCDKCGTIYPKPLFLPKFQCPFCKVSVLWTEPNFKPEPKQKL